MRKILLCVLALILPAISFVGCGDSSKKVTPVPTNAFAFLQDVPSQGLFSPMLGQYVSTGGSMRFQASVATDATSGSVVLDNFGSIYLSRDGSKVTFDLWSQYYDIFVAGSDGSLVQVTNDTYENLYPQLSPDGTKVVYRSYRESDSGMANMIVVRSLADPLGSEQVLPMPLGAYDTYDATFSPDGSKIAAEAYGYNETDGWFDGLVVMNADGSSPQLLTNPYASCECWDGYPAFTPDGSQIVYSGYTNTGTSETFDVYLINADGTSTAATLLTDGVGYSLDPLTIHVAGLADRIIFYSNRDNLTATNGGFELYSLNMDGSGLTRLTSNGVFDGFTQEYFLTGTSAKTANFGVRSRHAHPLAVQHGARHPMHGLKW